MKTNRKTGGLYILLLLFVTTVSGQVPPETSNRISFEESKVEIVDLIKEIQADNVKNSINEYNCFTREDYTRFVSDKVVEKVEEKLKRMTTFLISPNQYPS